MPAIAIDVAVLLSTDTRARVARMNARFNVAAGDGFRFDATHRPHVTLSQHFVNAERLTDVSAGVAAVLSGRPPLDLRVTGARRGRTAQALVVAPTTALQRVHERLMDALVPFEVPGGAAGFQDDDAPPRDADVAWVTRFRVDSSYARFDPHITVGIGPGPVTGDPFSFTAREIAICHLGRCCTCRNQLAHWTL